uniref:Uncharacterized protein n=1 Tax=viral metagenome TaxID=1070528 RepID=A0A6C0KVT5_9ZZZZ
MPYGNYYYGKDGFQYKKNGGAGVKRIANNSISNKPQELDNKYIPGSGVGATNISNRRAMINHASTCYSYKCGNSNYLATAPPPPIVNNVVANIDDTIQFVWTQESAGGSPILFFNINIV